MKNRFFCLMVNLTMFSFSTVSFAMNNPQTGEISSVFKTFTKGVDESKFADFDNALGHFKNVLVFKFQNPRFDEFSLQIQAAEKILEIYQKYYDLRQDEEDKSHINKYIRLLTDKYNEASEVLKRQGDFKNAILFARTLHELYKNKGHYTSPLSKIEYEFYFDPSQKTVYAYKETYYQDMVNDISNLALNANDFKMNNDIAQMFSTETGIKRDLGLAKKHLAKAIELSLLLNDKKITDDLVKQEKLLDQELNGTLSSNRSSKRVSVFNLFKK
jgi:hypothetical protein